MIDIKLPVPGTALRTPPVGSSSGGNYGKIKEVLFDLKRTPSLMKRPVTLLICH